MNESDTNNLAVCDGLGCVEVPGDVQADEHPDDADDGDHDGDDKPLQNSRGR